jgi:hypothetical protein
MKEVLRTSEPVQLSHAQSVLADAGITYVVFDGHMSIMEGSLSIIPRRLMVADGDFFMACSALKNAAPA